jgi:hypothetical protein
MNYLQEKNAIENHFTTAWGSTTPIVFENGEAPQDAVEWVRLSIQNGDAYQASLGDNPVFRHPGIVFVQIFTPKDDGSGRAIELADIVDGIFRNAVFSGIRFRVPQLNKVPSDSEWYQLNVSTEFYRGS